MPICFEGVEVTTVCFEGTEITTVCFEGVEVFSSAPTAPIADPPAEILLTAVHGSSDTFNAASLFNDGGSPITSFAIDNSNTIRTSGSGPLIPAVPATLSVNAAGLISFGTSEDPFMEPNHEWTGIELTATNAIGSVNYLSFRLVFSSLV